MGRASFIWFSKQNEAQHGEAKIRWDRMMKTVKMSGARAILPAALFPPAAWFDVAQKPDTLVCQHEHYVKQSLRNRIALVQSQGPCFVTVPVHRRGAASRGLHDILFTDKVHPDLLLKPRQTYCGSAPFFEHYIDNVERWSHDHLRPGGSWLEAALASTALACEWLGRDHPRLTSSYLTVDHGKDWRQKRLWRIASTAPYPQVFEDRLGFVEGRSILDVVFHLGPEAASLPSRHGDAPT